MEATDMKLLERRILEDGRALDGSILLVDSFVNHQVDMSLMREIGIAFADYFRSYQITRIVTVESSGIAPAGMTALELGVPLVICKKFALRITNGLFYQVNVQSFTKSTQYELTASKAYLPEGERVLFIDDFLAMGEAAIGVSTIIKEAKCELAGIGIVIEKTFQPGRARLDELGFHVFSLARIAEMSPGFIRFV
jgi:xanthine phosphoribosyltransferase